MDQLSRLRDATRLLRSAHAQFRASQLDLLLSIHLKPGQTQTELANECNLTLSAISRAVDVMGTSGRRDAKSTARLGWIEVRDNAEDDRIKQVFITPTGKQFLSLLEAVTYGG